MDLKEYIANSMQLTRQGTLNALQGVTQRQLTWRPAPNTNSIGFLLWHIARTEDWLFHLSIQPVSTPDLWESDGWKERLNVGPLPTSLEWTEEQLAAFRIPALDDLLAYVDVIRHDSLKILAELDPSRLSQVPPNARMNWTISRYLHQASHHQGAISYLMGLMKSQGIR